MKKTYISPELELIRFAPAERLASGDLDWDEDLGGNGDPLPDDNSGDTNLFPMPID